jgi:MFS family permease
VQEAAKLSLGLSDLQISLVQGVAASIPIAILSIPLGWLVDHRDRVRILICLGGVWTIGTLATVLANGFAALFFARMLAGLGAMCVLPAAISIAADLSAPERRGRSMVLLSLGNTAGGAAAFAVGGGLFGWFSGPGGWAIAGLPPWREVHLVFGAVSMLLLVPLFALRDPPRQEVVQKAQAIGPSLKELWDRRGLLLPLFGGQVSVVMADVAAGIWAAPVLTRSYHLQPGSFGAWFGLVVLVSGIGGSVAGGFAADIGNRTGWRGGILLGAVAAAALSIPASCFPIMAGVPGFAFMLGLLLFCGAVTGLVTATALTVLIPNEIRGVCLGAFIVGGAVIGFGVSPTLVTLGSSLLGGEAHLNMALAFTGMATSLLAFIGFVAAMARSAPIAAPTFALTESAGR